MMNVRNQTLQIEECLQTDIINDECLQSDITNDECLQSDITN